MHLYNNSTDTELVALLNEGNQAAFSVIYKRYSAWLYGYVRKNISRKEDCEEIIQEVFVSLWERRGDLQIATLKYYLLNAVRYKIIRYIQHKKVKAKYAEHFRLFETMYESIEEEQRAPEAIQSLLLKSIEVLPERCQLAIKLRVLENLSNSEIAQRMNITKKTVEVYMLKAFNHLRANYHNIYKTN